MDSLYVGGRQRPRHAAADGGMTRALVRCAGKEPACVETKCEMVSPWHPVPKDTSTGRHGLEATISHATLLLMKLVADLHIHSHYSRATSKDLTLEHLWKWAQLKGVNIVATGDIAHPGWYQEIQRKLEPAEPGLFRLTEEAAAILAGDVPDACRGTVRFMLAGEISNIYKRHGKIRKVHNIIFAPDLDVVGRIQTQLERIGNIRSDGRPILGLDSRDLLEMILEVDERCSLIPAHIWTPWFAMLGSMSGFDSVEECFGDLAPHIFALETGLSSDPPMNWRLSSLDRYTLVSNSDAHSPQKLAREATCFDCDLSYDAIFAALRSGDPATFCGTVEFFPEEGKYHVDGHRKCGICWHPATTLAQGGICPVCHKEVTVGVMHRVEMLADRSVHACPPRLHSYMRLVPLPEVLGELHGVGAGARRVQQEYFRILARLGSELAILRDLPLAEIAAVGGTTLAQGIDRMRRGAVDALPGYDGEYGVIRVFRGAAAEAETPQIALFTAEPAQRAEPQPLYTPLPSPPEDSPSAGPQESRSAGAAAPVSTLWVDLNEEQRTAVFCTDVPLIVMAGPGTGKTRTLTTRIAHLVRTLGVNPASILAITFTNKAAGEMRERLHALLGIAEANPITVKTFHAFGAYLLHTYAAEIGLTPAFVILDDEGRRELFVQAVPELDSAAVDAALAAITAAKNQCVSPDPGFRDIYDRYTAALRQAEAVDFDDLIDLALRLLESRPDVVATVRARYRWISVDEYQDVNLAQVRLLQLLAADGVNLCVIGDPDQAIYGFRGADRQHFLSFGVDYPGAQLVRLTCNYRSHQGILNAAMQVIAHNPQREAMSLRAHVAGTVRLDLRPTPTDKAEAETIVHQIEQMVGGTSHFSLDTGRADGLPGAPRGFGDFVVLYRLGAQARPLIEAFDRSGIPYQAIGQGALWVSQAARGVLAWLWLLHVPRSTVHLAQGLAAAGITSPSEVAVRSHALWDAGAGELGRAVIRAASELSAARRSRLEKVADFWCTLVAAQENAAVDELLAQICDFLAVEGALRDRLVSRAVPFARRLADFLAVTVLESEVDAYDPRADRVTLMTFHAAKGLEFPVVFMAGCEESLLPYMREGEPPDIEEERRLFYVGMTRAREKLILTYARTRFLFGRRMENSPSRFVGEIAAALVELRRPEAPPPARAPSATQLALFG